ncbi:Kinesin-like protein [Plasmodiophora brassicae]|uniref:Kinesin-like protein n=1 Tax=Plasmodiophora brassicae TaxID=37360 RepID=A0A3P3Y1D1_PLABS|nr:unnamed protein product [Plasmodiophora brassicae]
MADDNIVAGDDDVAIAGSPAGTVGGECVQVAIRCRPMSSKEIEQGHRSIVDIDKKMGQIVVHKPDEAPDPSERGRVWTYDIVFGSSDTQEQIYKDTASPIVDSVMEGYNGTIFAFGQTGTGKTWTMEGALDPPDHQGIIPRSIHHIFDRIESNQNSSKTFLVTVSFIEIYNDTIRDLLSEDNDPNALLDLKEDADRGVYVKGLENVAVENAKRIHQCLLQGQRKRKVGETNMNRHSSRSHCIFRITVETSETYEDGTSHIRAGKLNLVDLAGSERQSKTGATGVRLQEATKINLSLSALGNVIRALTSKTQTHVPYRNSKLTRLLQDSLGGNTKTTMIANIGPAAYNFEETTSTLRFASRAKHIQNKPTINEDPKDAQLRLYQEEIRKLKELLQSEGQLAMSPGMGAVVDGNTTVVQKVVERVVEKAGVDPSQLKKMELERAREREAFAQKARADKELMMAESIQAASESRRKEEELKSKQSGLEKERLEREKLMNKLGGIEKKLLHGSQIIDEAKRRAHDLQEKQHNLEKARREEELKMRLLRQKEEAQMEIAKKYDSQEAEVKRVTEKLKKVREKYSDIKQEIVDAQAELQLERETMLETSRDLSRQLQLKTLIIENFVSPQLIEKIRNRIEYDEDTGTCKVNPPDFEALNLAAKRPASVVPGQIRPLSEYSRIACALGNTNPRFRIDNILRLDFDLPERTTQDLDLDDEDYEDHMYTGALY